MAEQFEHHVYFSAPAYASGSSPALAQELIELIAEYLWDEPVQLARCCLACRAWYYAASQHLRRSVTLRNTNDLSNLARVLASARNRRYGRALEDIDITDNPTKPFAHTFPSRVRGDLLARLDELHFAQLDWKTVRPYMPFFTHLSRFTAVTRLVLSQCRFRRAEDLRDIIKCLPNLERLQLDTIRVIAESISLPLRIQQTSPAISFNRKLNSITLYTFGDYDSPFMADNMQPLHPNVIDVLSAYPTVEHLQLDTTRFISATQLRQFVNAFPVLRHIHLECNPEWDILIPPAESDRSLLAPTTNTHTWSRVDLSGVSSIFALEFFEFFAIHCCKLQKLSLSLLDSPFHGLQNITRQLLQSSGALLTDLWWECEVRSDEHFSDNVLPPLMHNTNLEDLFVAFRLPISSFQGSMLWVYNCLLTLLSYIKSPLLRIVEIYFRLQTPSGPHIMGFDRYAGTAGSIAVFHAILSRDIFAAFDAHCVVRVRFVLTASFDSEDAAMSELQAAVEHFVIPLFIPWLARGVVVLHLPDDSRIEHPPKHKPDSCR
ncbi:hypothetical protein DAEQUDRAFT_473657 [Daedalea quercina L-15889]|uniref:F-box domain-containing protein n=1 Tax=Daedalea quercina L-15889 TaxID=1314783 RepID=A0A165MZP3_9APHY|nr:hypothetical protein DAEQUDRAFT_473657 [Daedalea quercina L-15889]